MTPATGVWTSPDPIGILGGVNLYSYVKNNPVNFSDFLGLSEISDVNGGYADNGGLGYNGGNDFDGSGASRSPVAGLIDELNEKYGMKSPAKRSNYVEDPGDFYSLRCQLRYEYDPMRELWWDEWQKSKPPLGYCGDTDSPEFCEAIVLGEYMMATHEAKNERDKCMEGHK